MSFSRASSSSARRASRASLCSPSRLSSLPCSSRRRAASPSWASCSCARSLSAWGGVCGSRDQLGATGQGQLWPLALLWQRQCPPPTPAPGRQVLEGEAGSPALPTPLRLQDGSPGPVPEPWQETPWPFLTLVLPCAPSLDPGDVGHRSAGPVWDTAPPTPRHCPHLCPSGGSSPSVRVWSPGHHPPWCGEPPQQPRLRSPARPRARPLPRASAPSR